MRTKALDHIAVTVGNTARSLDFYVGKLGFVQVEQHQLTESSISPVFGLTGASGQSTRLIAHGGLGLAGGAADRPVSGGVFAVDLGVRGLPAMPPAH